MSTENGTAIFYLKHPYVTVRLLRGVLRKMKHIALFHARKKLAECLVLSRIGYNDVYFIKCQIILLIGCSVSTGEYVDLSDILKLDWLPVNHNMNWNLCKLDYKALNCEKWPPYLPLEVHVYQRTLRSSLVLNLVVLQVPGTFQDCAA